MSRDGSGTYSREAASPAAGQVINSADFTPEGREFFRFHTSQDDWREIVRVFGDAIREAHPKLAKLQEKLVQRSSFVETPAS